ncbi:probable amidase At4g34880 [Typha angustifolia]|uniref:probable amidase At4g34880 n=1 Tax=Typha angustifolia TaxID=59011 RepID=UPI003C2AC45D
MAPLPPFSFSILILLLLSNITIYGFEFKEATIENIHQAFKNNTLTSKQLVQYYLDRINSLNPLLRAVIEVNPAALGRASRADSERRSGGGRGEFRGGLLHGIPVLVKDNIATRDQLNTTAGSLALLGSTAARDAGVVRRLRRAGAVVLGMASLSEWAHFRDFAIPNGWCGRSGQGRNPYVLSADPCGSSSGSAIAAAANMAAVTVGTETDGSIVCPSGANSVVGIKPTVGLTCRAGVIPVSPRQDTIGPICRTVSDAVHVLDAIVGYDPQDAEATLAASKYIPQGGYKQFLNIEGLKGKRLGILKGFFENQRKSVQYKVFEKHFSTMRERGAVLIENLEIANVSIILDAMQSGELVALLAEFKLSLGIYLEQLPSSPVRSLADVIAFNKKHKIKEKLKEFGQTIFLMAQNTSGIGVAERSAISRMAQLSMEGIERLMTKNKLDAIIVIPDSTATSILAIGGYPGISVPAGYDQYGVPFVICFGGLKGSEPKLIEISYAFEQATLVREPPLFKTL